MAQQQGAASNRNCHPQKGKNAATRALQPSGSPEEQKEQKQRKAPRSQHRLHITSPHGTGDMKFIDDELGLLEFRGFR